MKKYSELTFNQLSKDLGFVKVWWNHKLIYDDTGYLPLVDLNDLYDEYGNRYVYKMKIKVVDGHHCELKVKGEKEFTPRKLVIGLYLPSKDEQSPNLYEYDLVDSKDIESTFEKVTYKTNEKLYKEVVNEIAKHEYFRYVYDQNFIYKVKVNNIDKYPWIKTCKEFYIIK